jgi:hypothetical protein
MCANLAGVAMGKLGRKEQMNTKKWHKRAKWLGVKIFCNRCGAVKDASEFSSEAISVYYSVCNACAEVYPRGADGLYGIPNEVDAQAPEVRRKTFLQPETGNPLPRQRGESVLGEMKPGRNRGVYLIKGGETGLYKIGMTTDFDSRFNDLQGASPVVLDLVCLISTNNISRLESMLHYKYRLQRKWGEWFALSADDVKEIEGLLHTSG